MTEGGAHVGGGPGRTRGPVPAAAFSDLVGMAPDAVVIVDPDGRVVDCNDEAELVTGWDRDALLGELVEVLLPEDLKAVHAQQRTVYTGAPHRRSMRAGRNLLLRRADGAEIAVDVSLNPVTTTDGLRMAAIVRDPADHRPASDVQPLREQHLARAERLARIGSWTYDVERGELQTSIELERIYGFPRDHGPAEFEDVLARIHPEDRDRIRSALGQLLRTAEPQDHELRILRPDGEVRWLRSHWAVAEHRGGRPVRFVGYSRDVTEQRRAEHRRRGAQEALAQQRAALERIVRGEPVEETMAAQCREVERRFPGITCTVLVADETGERLLDGAAPSMEAAARRAIDDMPIGEGMAACGTAAARGELVVIPDVSTDPLTATWREFASVHGLRSVWSHPLRNAAGGLLGTMAVYRGEPHVPDEEEVAAVMAAGTVVALALERRQAERAMALAAQVDPLTGLPNRTRFMDRLRARIAAPDGRVAVLFLDLDRFKWINDSMGHAAGDRVLGEAATRLSDAIGDRHMLARFGGDEFTLLVEDATEAQIAEVADAAMRAVERPFVLDGGEFFLTLSIGVAVDDGSTGAEGLVRDADAAMYAAKERGRARYVIFDQRLRGRAMDRVVLESDLRRALVDGELAVHYQPVVDLRTGAWAGAEALVRWHHPTRGMMSPAEFIPLAEETGLVVPLGDRVLEAAVAQAAAWARARAPTPIAVNTSVLQLADPNLGRRLDALLRRHDLDPRLLVLEITETAIMQELEMTQHVLAEVRALGVRLEVDDFGTGYSSIARLAELPVEAVKIDRAFTARLEEHHGRDSVLAAIVDLAHALGLRATAEGVETAAALDRLRALGCDHAQGFHIARPGPPEEIARLFRPPAERG